MGRSKGREVKAGQANNTRVQIGGYLPILHEYSSYLKHLVPENSKRYKEAEDARLTAGSVNDVRKLKRRVSQLEERFDALETELHEMDDFVGPTKSQLKDPRGQLKGSKKRS
jgi:predicted  nucleic acid-binding Zn-ribbon protein